MQTIKYYRGLINWVDRLLVAVLALRWACVKKIQQAKVEAGLPAEIDEREAEIMARLKAANKSGYDVSVLYGVLFEQAKTLYLQLERTAK